MHVPANTHPLLALSPPGPAEDVTLRPIRAADLAALRSFVQGLSRETAYLRLLSGRTPTEEELRGWTAIDTAREGAIVAVTPHGGADRIVGVARYVRESPSDADFAIVIADAWQHRGLGKALLSRLVEAARKHGVRRLTGLTLPSNAAMLSLARSLGFRTMRQPGATTFLSLDLRADASFATTPSLHEH
jgi:acetyltransferase